MYKSLLLSSVYTCIFTLAASTTSTAAIFYTDEASFNAALGGINANIESFETPFTTATTVNFSTLSVTQLGGGSGIVSCPTSSLCGGALPTDGSNTIGIVDNNFNGNQLSFDFSSPINAFSIDVVAALDFGGFSQFILSNDNGDSQTMFTGPIPTETRFVGLSDFTRSFSNVTINSTLTGDGIQFDRVQHVSVVPIPAALWLFGSGLLGLVGMAIRK
ncbi:MAG: VPLPA-CTERM sorting domain-containing protein [Candidatus Thiodiazotropha endolucinida]